VCIWSGVRTRAGVEVAEAAAASLPSLAFIQEEVIEDDADGAAIRSVNSSMRAPSQPARSKAGHCVRQLRRFDSKELPDLDAVDRDRYGLEKEKEQRRGATVADGFKTHRRRRPSIG